MGQRIGKKFKRLLLTGLLMIALLTACAGKGEEESIEQSEADYKGITVGNAASTGTDVVILMDESGSMVKADTDRIAIEGAKLFVDMEKLDNAKIGLVEFSNVIKSTGLLDMSDQSGRESIKAVMNGISYSGKAHTDTGAGLLEAISLLEQSGSYEKRSIILFTDGRTDIDAGTKGRTTEDSLADVDRAIQAAQEKGYTIYCIGLNDNNSVDLEQLAKIATETGGQYLVTTDVSSITDFFERIFADIGNSDISSLDEYVSDGEYHEVRFKIDNANVMEANIVILSSKEVEDVTLQNPSGETVDLKSDEKVVFTKSDKYTIVKLILPQTGEWCVNVKGVDGDAIKIGRIFNYDLKLVVEADRTELTTEGEVNLKAYLATADTPLQDSAFYQTMTGYVQITGQTEESWEEPLEWDETEKCMMKSGLKFEASGNYNMRVHLEGNGFYRDSEDIPVYVSKDAPVIVKSLSEIKLHQDKTKEVDLSEYFEDKEGSAITYVPLAVIITQSDLIAPEKKMFWNPEPELLQKCLMPGKRFDTNIFSYCTRDVKTYLESSNVKDIVGKIRSSFPKCNYFSVAAYGVPITGEEKVQKAPYGIALPFLWTEAALGYLIPTAMIKKYPKKKLFQKEAGEPVTIFENAEEKLYAE